jgi:hypothetical protein
MMEGFHMEAPHRILLLLLVVLAMETASARGQDPDSLWRHFTSTLLRGEMTADRLRPHLPSLTEPLLGFLETLRRDVPAEQWERTPEIHRVGDLIHYIIPFTDGRDTSVFCFTLTVENRVWYFCHLENIFIRLDKVTALPTSTFPDLPEPTKAWMREENYWSFIVHLYGVLTKARDTDAFLDLLRDGQGYVLAAKTWVPFVEPRRAFVLYLCWEQSILRGNHVVLEHLSDTLARVSITAMFFQLYKRTAHLKGQITPEAYRRIFETIWQDRARNAGWVLTLDYPDDESCVFTLRSR